jgi:hypothetical protein
VNAGSGDGREEPPVGSVGEEAAKLFEALQDWASENGASAAVPGGLQDQWRLVNEHIATGGKDCTYCPVCQVIAKVRETSPEVRTHLAVAASSLLQAAAMLVEARGARARPRDSGVTRIDLDDDGSAEDAPS